MATLEMPSFSIGSYGFRVYSKVIVIWWFAYRCGKRNNVIGRNAAPAQLYGVRANERSSTQLQVIAKGSDEVTYTRRVCQQIVPSTGTTSQGLALGPSTQKGGGSLKTSKDRSFDHSPSTYEIPQTLYSNQQK